MAGYLTPLLVVLVIVVAANALSYKNAKYNPRRWMVGGRRHHGLVPKPNRNEKSIIKSAVAQQMDQLVDHFNPADKSTFRQRYWFNNVYYKRGGPAFLMLGGESEESSSWVEYPELHYMKMAKSHNAMVFLLEHRYYGDSRPTKDMSTANLKYLSSEQGLEDAAAFIKKMNAEFNFTNTKWITFGGSYSGALSGWMREKYPNLVSGAVASSAPVLAEVDFIEYLEVVQTALTTYSPACALNVKRGMAEVQRLMTSAAGRKTLEDTFSLCYPIMANSSDDIKYFYEAVIGNYMGVVQYSGDNAGYYRNSLTIPKICSFHMTNATTPLEQLGQVNSYLMQYNEESCVYISYAGWIDYARQTSFDATSASTRAWLWQTCTEFGYYQSTDSKTAGAFFGAVWPVNFYVKQCAEIYGPQYNNGTVYAAVAKTNSFYGGRDRFTATQVVLPNGSNDPWHKLGILTSKYPSYTAVVIKGTSHCADMYAAASDDVPALKTARETIEMQVATWLSH